MTKKKVPEVLTRRLLQQTTPRGQMVDQMEVVDVDMTTAQISAGKIHKRSMYMYDWQRENQMLYRGHFNRPLTL